jgi:E3 ubiquitin-protein ligase TRIP12
VSSAAAAAGTSASGTVTPRAGTGSYAGAVKAKPQDWHVQFYMGGEKLDAESTVYGAVHKYLKKNPNGLYFSPGQPRIGGAFGGFAPIKFIRVEGPPPKHEGDYFSSNSDF